MFEGLRWHKPSFDAEAAMRHAADSLAQAGKAPLVVGSLAAVALLGMLTRMGLSRRGRGRSKATVIAARVRDNGNTMHGARNGRRRKKRKTKAAMH